MPSILILLMVVAFLERVEVLQRPLSFTTTFNMFSPVEGKDPAYSFSTKSENPEVTLEQLRTKMGTGEFRRMRITLSGRAVRQNSLSSIFPVLSMRESSDGNMQGVIQRVNQLKSKHAASELSLKLNGSYYKPK